MMGVIVYAAQLLASAVAYIWLYHAVFDDTSVWGRLHAASSEAMTS